MRVSPVLCRDSSESLDAVLEKNELLPANNRLGPDLPMHGPGSRRDRRQIISLSEIQAMRHLPVLSTLEREEDITEEDLATLDCKISTLERRGILNAQEAQAVHLLFNGAKIRKIAKALHIKNKEVSRLVNGAIPKIQTGSAIH